MVDFPLFIQVKELNHYLEAEKSCRTDLEMYVAVLNTQKSVLQEDAEKLRKELHEGTYVLIILLTLLCKDVTQNKINSIAVTSLLILYLSCIWGKKKMGWRGSSVFICESPWNVYKRVDFGVLLWWREIISTQSLWGCCYAVEFVLDSHSIASFILTKVILLVSFICVVLWALFP